MKKKATADEVGMVVAAPAKGGGKKPAVAKKASAKKPAAAKKATAKKPAVAKKSEVATAPELPELVNEVIEAEIVSETLAPPREDTEENVAVAAPLLTPQERGHKAL